MSKNQNLNVTVNKIVLSNEVLNTTKKLLLSFKAKLKTITKNKSGYSTLKSNF
jgi:hypothetical protein